MDETTGGDEILDPLFEVGHADGFRPPCERFEKRHGLRSRRRTQLFKRAAENLFLDVDGRIRLLDGNREPLQKRFVQQVGPDKPTVVGAAPLGVRRRKNGESRLRSNRDAELLDGQRTTLKHGLEAHHLGRCQVDLIDGDGAAAQHRDGNRSQFEHGLAVLQAEPTDEIVLISFERDVDTDVFDLLDGARLLHLERLAVSRQPSDEHGVELLRLDDLSNDIEFTERNERRIALRHFRECRRLRDQVFNALENVRRAGGLVNRERQRRGVIDNGIRRRNRSIERDTRRRGRLGARRRGAGNRTSNIHCRQFVLSATPRGLFIQRADERTIAATGVFEIEKLTTGH